MLRNELRATSLAEDPDFIDIPGMDTGSGRDEEEIEAFEERVSGWIDKHTD